MNLGMKTRQALTWAVASLAVSTSAHALTTLASPLSGTPQSFSETYGGVTALPGEPFRALVLFTLNQSGQAVLGTFSALGGSIDLESVYIEPNLPVFAAGSTATAGSTFSATVTPVQTAGGYSFRFDAVPADSGTYILGLRGVFGAQGAQGFQGTLSATAAVPEPGTWALMGLGLVGVVAAARRRRAD